MYTIDFSILSFLFCINAIPTILMSFNIKNNYKKIYFLFSIASIFLYSGFGLSYEHIESKYILHYVIFSTVYIISLYLIFKYKLTFSSSSSADAKVAITTFKKDNSEELKYMWIINIGTVLYLLTYIVFLLIPSIRISHIWNPPTSSLVGIYDTLDLQHSNVILSISQTIRTFLMPFYMIKLYLLKKENKSIRGVLLIIIWAYLDFLSILYIGRYMMLVYLLFIFLYFLSDKDMNLKIKKKYYLLIVACIIAIIPLFATYQYSRLGLNIGDLSFLDSLSILSDETMFPEHYQSAVELSNNVSPIGYAIWLIILPIPFIPDKSAISLLVNREFSTYVLGIEYGHHGYYGLLPSILGEAIIIFNEYFYFIHAIFLALAIGTLCKILIKNKELAVMNTFLAIRLLSFARGGSQGYLGLTINSLVFYFIIKQILNNISMNKIEKKL